MELEALVKLKSDVAHQSVSNEATVAEEKKNKKLSARN